MVIAAGFVKARCFRSEDLQDYSNKITVEMVLFGFPWVFGDFVILTPVP